MMRILRLRQVLGEEWEAGVSQYLHVEGHPILAVENGTVHVKRSQFPEFSLVVARHVENGAAWYVLQRGAGGMVGTLIALTPGHRCQQPSTDPPEKIHTNVTFNCKFVLAYLLL